MLNKITEPQAIYSKAPTPGQPAHANFTTPPKKPSKLNWKIAGSIVAVCLVAVVGVAGVLIAQRQQADQTPVAPNAPQSQPQAAIETSACSISFEVKTTTPTPTPPPGSAKCISKTAKIVGTTTNLAPNAVVKPGDVIEFATTVNIPLDEMGREARVVITDTISPQLQYVLKSGTADITDYDPAVPTKVISEFPGGRGSDAKTETFTYKAQVKTAATVAEITSNSVVVTSEKPASADSSCKIALKLQAAPTGVASCVSKVAYKGDTTTAFGSGAPGTAVSLVKRGEVVRYQITVKANALTSGPVEIKDVLPNTLTYQPASARIGTRTPTAAEFSIVGQTLTFKPGVMASSATNRELVLTYKATVKADAPVAPFKNTVTVSTNGNPVVTPPACTVNLYVAPVGAAFCASKTALTDYGGTPIEEGSTVQKGSTFTYRLFVDSTEPTAGGIEVVDTLPSSLEFVDSKAPPAMTHSNGKISASLSAFGTPPNRGAIFEYKVRVKEDAPAGSFSNAVTVTTAGVTSPADTCSFSLQLPYQCDSNCTTDAQCNNNGSSTSYICSEEAGNKCRRASNPDSASCSSTETEYSCNSSCDNDSQCQEEDDDYICAETSEGDRCRHKDYQTRANCEAPSTPTPTPSIGCNDSCTSNADCSNPSHICYNDGNGTQLCRLETNPTSASCTNPGTPGQPQLPQELPQTGPEDWVNWLKAGLITLGIGAALLLLL